ncbi:carbonate dehydratase, eukaryotic-type [Ostertagia ostertagi]
MSQKRVNTSPLFQSPIDIRASDVDYALLHQMQFVHYDHSGTVNVINNGHTVAVDGFDEWGSEQPFIQGGGLKHHVTFLNSSISTGLNTITKDRSTKLEDCTILQRYVLGPGYTVYIHPIQLHLVHVRQGIELQEALKRPDGIAVVGVFLVIGHDDAPLSSLSPVLGNVTHYGNETVVQGFRLRPLLPAHTEAFYRYEGSLTTPNCDEAVIWTVLAEPITITLSQVSTIGLIKDFENKKNLS